MTSKLSALEQHFIDRDVFEQFGEEGASIAREAEQEIQRIMKV